jgi:sn-glycerol 3-phosphate transport system ATP-binding protein
MIAGLEAITEGEVSIGGRVVNRLEPGERDIAMVFQNYALYPHMTVRKNMEYGLKNQGMPKPEIADASPRPRAPCRSSNISNASPARFRAGSGSASPWAAPSCASRPCSCSTSRCRTSTRSSAPSSARN